MLDMVGQQEDTEEALSPSLWPFVLEEKGSRLRTTKHEKGTEEGDEGKGSTSSPTAFSPTGRLPLKGAIT